MKMKIGDKIEVFDVFGRSLQRGILADPKDDTFNPRTQYDHMLTYTLLEEHGNHSAAVMDYCHWVSLNNAEPYPVVVPSRAVMFWREKLPIAATGIHAPIEHLRDEAIANFFALKPEYDRPDLVATASLERSGQIALVTITVTATNGFDFEDAFASS